VLFGRAEERTVVGALLEGARRSRSGALVLRGEPGIGKTALLEDARERAGDFQVLSARGVESESELPHAALHQLLRPAMSQLETLPEPQAAALRGALGLDQGGAQERFLVFAACLSLLSEMSEQRPVLCLVDDAHWLDSASADALRFVARRLDAEGIVILFAAREGEVRRFEAVDVPSLLLEGLDGQASATLLARTTGEVALPVRERLIEHARGNALALVELPSVLTARQRAGQEPLPDVLPLTEHLERIFLERVRRLPDDTQRLLLLAAADDSEDAGLVTRAAELLGADGRALDAAEQAGLVSVHGSRLEFRHPLVRSAVYEAATSGDRRGAHRALADALARPADQRDRRAWHLAASALEPEESVVCALQETARRAEERAGYMAAAKALARAAELSADTEARGHHLVRAARCARIAGADDYAVGLANQALPLVEDSLLRAEIAYALGVAEFRRGRPVNGLPGLLEGAREVSRRDPRRALELLIWAIGAAWVVGDLKALAEVSELAEAVASPDKNDESVYVARALTGFAQATGAETATDDTRFEEALAWAATSDNPWHVFAVSAAALFTGDEESSATLADRAISLARTRGELGVLAEALTARASGLQAASRFDEAVLAAGEAAQFARELGAVNTAARPESILAIIAAIRGDKEGARRRAEDLLGFAAARGLSVTSANALYALAMLDLGCGRWSEALERLETLIDAHPRARQFALPNAIEAATRAGRRDKARTWLSAFGAWQDSSGAAWAQPVLASCRALVVEGEEASQHFEQALRLGSQARPFDLARIRLLYGEHLRRERRRIESRPLLRAALEGFERLRAEPWAERARKELRASGETARKRDPSTIDQLTPRELQIAHCVAEGLSNREVAAQLFLSTRTIEYHLRHVFAKLGVTSRTQLVRLPLAGGGAVAGNGPLQARA